MALTTYDAALTAIREVLDDGHGSVRTIAASRFSDVLVEGLSEEEAQRRSMVASKPFRVRFAGARRHPASPPINSTTIIEEFDVVVVVSRLHSVAEHIDADEWATAEALAWEDASAIRQALETPPNLATTVAGTSTNIIGDALRWTGSTGAPAGSSSQTVQRYVCEHRFTGAIKVSPA